MTTQPSIVLVHGFWGGAAHWSGMIGELFGRGWDETTVHAVENSLSSLAEDAERTQKMIKQIDGPVLLVGHSYGGAVITEAGDLPNVVGLVYVAAFVPDVGESLASLSEPAPPAAGPYLSVDSDGFLWIAPDKFHESFAADLPEEQGKILGVTQKAPLATTFGDTLTQAAWKTKPSWTQVSTQDRMIDPGTERQMAARTNPRGSIELEASHASLASQPKAIADLIVSAATAVTS